MLIWPDQVRLRRHEREEQHRRLYRILTEHLCRCRHAEGEFPGGKNQHRNSQFPLTKWRYHTRSSGKPPSHTTVAKPASPSAVRPDRVFSLASELEDPLNQALAIARAIQLMGFGLHNVDDDLASAFVTIAEAQTARLAEAKIVWREIMTATGKRRA